MNYDELSEWCIQNRDLPDDSNTSFVVSYQINIDGDDAENFPDSVATVENPITSMRLFISTRHLISLASTYRQLASSLQADATYKLVWLKINKNYCNSSSKYFYFSI